MGATTKGTPCCCTNSAPEMTSAASCRHFAPVIWRQAYRASNRFRSVHTPAATNNKEGRTAETTLVLVLREKHLEERCLPQPLSTSSRHLAPRRQTQPQSRPSVCIVELRREHQRRECEKDEKTEGWKERHGEDVERHVVWKTTDELRTRKEGETRQ